MNNALYVEPHFCSCMCTLHRYCFLFKIAFITYSFKIKIEIKKEHDWIFRVTVRDEIYKLNRCYKRVHGC